MAPLTLSNRLLLPFPSHSLLPCLLLLLLPSPSCSLSYSHPPVPVVSRIAFGSCAKQSSPQPIWDAILDFRPDLFVWMGDNIYGDNKRPFRIFREQRTIGPWKNVDRFFPSSQEELKRRYELAKNKPGYAELSQRTKVIGTWDDHDYGLNDAGKEFAGKDVSQKLLMDFLDEPEDSPRRKQAGVYASYVYGPEGKQIKVIVLDTRYHRDPIFSDGTFLGDAQWEWLEKELKGPKTELTIIVSSVQVISNLSATGYPLLFTECWGNFPKERERLFKLINDSKRSGVFFISGDVHFGEIARYDCGSLYPIYDITSSGLTRSLEEDSTPAVAFLIRAIFRIVPSTMRVFSANCRHKSCIYARPNFGAIEVNWDVSPPRVKIELRDVNGSSVNEVSFLLSELQAREVSGTGERESGYQQHCTLERESSWLLRKRLTLILWVVVTVLLGVVFLLLRAILSTLKRLSRKIKID
ncbi:Calcineurin-like metallo-phosphoesterase superfamily protein [Rhynchospora pubera]|uniref:Calcineurin-like metallo-phosphoesterase superfamily protein n=1 Tax=Rhynchospora pubera TaxID=906938 RepID=A0AAV8HSD7_9POAL|nr:Calcineurin-like metallo-phosphoesterase superfamily protein [Rhynchospora pubera]